MTMFLTLLFAAALFVFGLRLSAFFSGSETGYYRLSLLQLSLLPEDGNGAVRQLRWFARHPDRFVATALVGNNVANYFTTVAVGLASVTLMPHIAGTAEILGTLALTPVVFIFGELIPKSLYYRSPLSLMRRGIRWFAWCDHLFYPLTIPLLFLTRLVNRSGKGERRPLELALGRHRLVNVLEQGKEHGLVSDFQTQLVDSVLDVAELTIRDVIRPTTVVFGTVATASADDVLSVARTYGTTHVMLHEPGRPGQWTAYVRVADLIAGVPLERARREMPVFSENSLRLEVLESLLRSFCRYGAVTNSEGQVIGTISSRMLSEPLFRARSGSAGVSRSGGRQT